MSQTDSDSEIDFDHLNQYVDGDPMFQHQVEMWGRMLDANSDDETWAAVTHSLKGSANAVGATRLAVVCKKSEGLVKTRNKLGLRDMAVQNIEHHIARAITEIQRWEYRQKIQKIKSG